MKIKAGAAFLAKFGKGAELLADIAKTGKTKLAEIFSDEAAVLASQRAKKKLASITLYSGAAGAEVLADLAIVAGNKIKNGVVKFGEFSQQLVDEFGETVKPYVEKLYREKMIELNLGDKIDEVGIKNTKLEKIVPNPDSIIDPPKAVRRQDLAGKTHPVTNVSYDRNGYPIFESRFDAKLSKNLQGNTVSDYDQFKEATKQLKQRIEANPEYKKNFTDEQIKDIMAEKPKITGLTWHHHQDGVRLQLVDYETHRKSGHDGGRKNTGGRP